MVVRIHIAKIWKVGKFFIILKMETMGLSICFFLLQGHIEQQRSNNSIGCDFIANQYEKDYENISIRTDPIGFSESTTKTAKHTRIVSKLIFKIEKCFVV